jgi:8-oxo-(d)GTP phosphatase
MLYFGCDKGQGAEKSLLLFGSLADAESSCSDRLLVVDGSALEGTPGLDQHWPVSHQVPSEAVLNANPYRPPMTLIAAGGYVIRQRAYGPEVLLIFRRGVWDLPKGKQDSGETIEACALREVREEVGINDLELVRSLGTSTHTYPLKKWYAIKTTHWFMMRTSDRDFTPQSEEDIDEVEWFGWSEAKEKIGYRSLKEHMDTFESDIVSAMNGL